ncbi:MAG: TonB-dependent receptor [Arenicella sp.]|nr:TonB-dependent receptor [Arenicella sp.]
MNMNLKPKKLVLIINSAIAFSGIAQVNAQSEGYALEEIVVTAQKRSESLQDTPIAITAFTANGLADKGVQDISEIAQLTPSLVFDTASPIGGASSAAAVFIRGIGNTDFSLTTDPGVGTYVDGVYVSRSIGGVLDVLDVERIEILRGPQGTLFGRNTIGGALSITSRKPAQERQGSVAATVGNDGRFNVRGSLDLPINETLRTSFAVSSKQRDGFVENPITGGEALGDEGRVALRGTVVYEPNDSWGFQFSADYAEIDETSSPNIPIAFTPGAATVGFADGSGRSVPEALGFLNSQFTSTPEDDLTFGQFDSFSETEVIGASFVANYHTGNHDIKYIGSYRQTDSRFSADADASPFQITEIVNPDYQHEQTTHELQFTGAFLDSRLKYVAGLYAFEEEGIDSVRVPVSLPISVFGPLLNPDATAFISNFARVDNDSVAAYLQLTYDINDVFSVTGGVRRTEDTKEYSYAQFLGPRQSPSTRNFFPTAVPAGPFLPIVGSGVGTVKEDFDDTSFKFGVDATLEGGTLFYYSYTEGFKSGGFVLRYVIPVPEPLSFDPEVLSSHEVGIKWQSTNNRVRLNAAIYSSDYEDVQVTLFDAAGGPITANAGTADIQGFEFELTALLTDRLKLELGYGYTDAEYTSLNNVPGLSLAVNLDSQLVNTPENTLSLSLEYAIEIANKGLIFRANYSYTDELFNDSQNSEFLFQDAVDLIGISAKLEISDNTDLVAWVKNATDERYIITGNSNFGLGFHSAVVNRPREFGVTFRHRF